MEQETFDCDVLVVGSGASGMSTAVTAASQGLKVLVVEKEPRFGGTTARSGGWLWIPGTRLATEQGITRARRRRARVPEARSHDALRRRPRRCLPGERAEGDRLLHAQHARAIRHAGRVSRTTTPRPSAASLAGRSMVARPFDGRELGKQHQAPGSGASGAHGVRNDVGLRQGDQTLHAGVQVVRVVRLRHQAPQPAHARRAARTVAA